ncbi:MAG TPA: Hsp33 family molecular chaperone HslO [Geobacteraceae bacterium]|nr:Hsp33 family molecular chaperone HslO [Geobacteraceae bacterium]
MSDYLVRTITKTGTVRALACVTTELVGEACRRHGTRPTASAALGRALTGGALFGALLKTGQRVALRFEGNGPLKKIIVEAEANGAVSGYVGVPEVDLPDRDGKLDVAGAVGRAGFITVSRDLGLKEPYRGTVQLYSSEIAEDLAYYLTSSEQIPSAVGLGVLVATDGAVAGAGGFLVQALPGHDDSEIDLLMERIGGLSRLSEQFAAGTTPEELLERLFDDMPYDILEKRALAFRCSCSRERVERALIAFGADELRRLIAEQGEAAATCEFCREPYTFNREELEGVLAGMAQESGELLSPDNPSEG